MASGVISMIDKTPLINGGSVSGSDIVEAAKNFFDVAPGTNLPSIARFFWNGWRFAFIFKTPDAQTGVMLVFSFTQSATTIPFLRRYQGVWKDSYIALS